MFYPWEWCLLVTGMSAGLNARHQTRLRNEGKPAVVCAAGESGLKNGEKKNAYA